MYDNFFTKAHELTKQGIPIGGSCAQPTVIKAALQALADDESRLIRLSTDIEAEADGATGAGLSRPGLIDLPMTCFSGGTLEIYIEPQQPRPRLLIIGTLPIAQALAHLAGAMNYHVIAVPTATMMSWPWSTYCKVMYPMSVWLPAVAEGTLYVPICWNKT